MDFEAFKREWVKNFAGDVSAEDIQRRMLCHGMAWNFLWHAFSWQLLPDGAYLTGDDARRAFEEANKDGAIEINPFDNEPQSAALPSTLRNAKAIKAFTEEYYVAGRDFAWTYIQTHEGECGPYFCLKRTGSAANYDVAVRMNAMEEQRLAAEEKAALHRKRRNRLAAMMGMAAVGFALCVWIAGRRNER